MRTSADLLSGGIMMRYWMKRVAAVAIVAAALTGSASRADASPSKLCSRVDVNIYTLGSYTQCIAMP
jgi:hypothetical protein